MKNTLPFFLSVIVIFNVVNCPKPKNIGNLINERIQNPYDESQSMNIFFATPRAKKTMAMRACSNSFFNSSQGDGLRYGKCIINVPSHHTIGSLDSAPSGPKDKFYHFLDMKEMDETKLISTLSKSSNDDILLFVHGFNVGFEEAILRASQMKYDMKFQGEVVLLTWPAGSEDDSILGQLFMKDIYQSNYRNAISSRINFKEFLLSLEKTQKKIHVVVHSMGHQVVLPVMNEMGRKNKKKLIGELILNAPDYDSMEFGKIIDGLTNLSERVTMYCSPGDNALIASQKVNGGRRAGVCNRYKGIDVININEVDDPVLGIGGLGHGYYSSRPILTDMYQVLLGVSVEKRLFIRKSGTGNAESYVLRK